jgi:hypothetical protein
VTGRARLRQTLETRQSLRVPVTYLVRGQAADVTADDVVGDFTRASGPGRWRIITAVCGAYETHQCPVCDIAGWRKERVPNRPTGIIDTAPDWVCEIVSPGHKRKDTLDLFLLLQRHRVP